MGSVCEGAILDFIKLHPDVTVVVEYDTINESYIIGINSTRGGKFYKYSFMVKNSGDASERVRDELDRINYEMKARESK